MSYKDNGVWKYKVDGSHATWKDKVRKDRLGRWFGTVLLSLWNNTKLPLHSVRSTVLDAGRTREASSTSGRCVLSTYQDISCQPPPSGQNLAKSRGGGFGGSRDNPFLVLLRRYDVRMLRFAHNYIKKHCIFIKIY